MVAADGGVFKFGSVEFFGSAATVCPNAPAAAIAMSCGARGYWIAFTDAVTYAFCTCRARRRRAVRQVRPSADVAARDFFDRLNAERAARGLPAVGWDPRPRGATRRLEPVTCRRTASATATSATCSTAGGSDMVGENIAVRASAGVSAGGLHGAWMHSDGHRANMLSPAYDLVGVGVYCAPNGSMFATTSFGRSMSLGAAPGAGTPPVDPVVRPDPGSSTC